MAGEDEREEGSGETDKERVDRELIELLNELRVALPGIQTLFAFLLILPFSNGWQRTSGFERDVYVAAVLTTGVSTLLLIAPSAQHRLAFRAGDKEHLLKQANRFAIAGIAALAAAMTIVLYLIVEVVLGRGWAATIGIVAAASFSVTWFALPLLRRARQGG